MGIRIINKPALYNIDAKIPLLSVNVNGTFYDNNGILDVEQIYENNYETPIESIYYFSLDSNANITNLKLIIGEKMLTGILQSKENAKKGYDTALVDKKRVSLLEKIDENKYKIYLGNLEKNDKITIQYSYCTTTEYYNDELKFIFPTNIGQQYIQQTMPNVAPNTEKNIIPYSNQTNYKFNLNITWNSQNIIEYVRTTCNTGITIKNISKTTKQITTNTIPSNGDFALFIKIDTKQHSIYHYEENNKHYIYCNIKIPDEEKNTKPKKYSFIIDRSGSMKGDKMEHAIKTLKLFLLSITQSDMFNIISFGTDYKVMFDEHVYYSDETIKQAISSIETFGADMGGTEIYKCIEHLVKNTVNTDFDNVFMVLTDGQVSNRKEIVNMLKNHKGTQRIFSVGIGKDADRVLIESLAIATNGLSEMIHDSNSLEDTVINMLNTVSKQYYTEPISSFANLDFSVIYPNKFYGISTVINDSEYEKFIKEDFIISGTDPITDTVVMWNFKMKNICEGTNAIKTIYVKHIINTVKDKQKIIEASLGYGIVSDYTSLVATDDAIISSKENMKTVMVPQYQNFNDIPNITMREVHSKTERCRKSIIGNNNICPNWCDKQKQAPLFNPVTDISNIYEIPVMTDYEKCYVPSKERRNEKSFKPIKITNGLHFVDQLCDINKPTLSYQPAYKTQQNNTYENINDLHTSKFSYKQTFFDVCIPNKMANGSFKLDLDLCKFIGYDLITDLENVAGTYGATREEFYNVMLLKKIRDMKLTQYKLIEKNLEAWINKNVKSDIVVKILGC
jgi:hypothetical protein